jgi:hypothetical protein
LLAQVIIQQAMLKAIQGLAGFSGQVREPGPYQEGASNVIALDARLAALALFQAGQLFCFTVKLLDLPAPATHLLCARQSILRQVIGDDPIRAVGRHHNPEQFHLVHFGKSLDLDHLAISEFLFAPSERIDPAIFLLAVGVVNLAIVLERAVITAVQ